MIADALTTDEQGCRLDVGDDRLDLSWRWLRDHARDHESFLASAQQRVVTPDAVASAGSGTATLSDRRDVLVVAWPDGPTAEYPVEWLSGIAEDAGGAASIGSLVGEPQPWNGDQLAGRLVRTNPALLDTPEGLADALRSIVRDGVLVIADVPTDTDTTRQIIERFGYVRMTIFGDLWEFRSDGGFDDTASTPLEITPHTDGTYSHDAPGLLALHCHAYDAEGGENVFVCGHELDHRLLAESPRHHELLRTVDVPGQYVGDGAHLMAKRPPLRYERGRLAQISYNHHDRAPFLLPEPTMTELLDALAHLDRIANDPAMQFEVELRPRDMVVFDNWRVLHGRRAFRGDRLIAGGYVNREDLESTVRRTLGSY
ncbi:MAG: TauD/TfdA family dioxygenase [Actinomycetota bacterium]